MKYNVKGLNELSAQINQFTIRAGFDNNDVPLRIVLIHSEVSELFDTFRKDEYAEKMIQIESDKFFKEEYEVRIKDSFEDELADCMIRLLDLAAKRNINIEYHIQQKMRYNENRGFKYGGKKF